MRLLISAYACESGRGSEPGIGWTVAEELGRRHEVWVLTNSRHRRAIEARLAQSQLPTVKFIYHDLPRPLRLLNRDGPCIQAHYYLWQYSAFPTALRLHREMRFDLCFHATYGRHWSPSLMSLLSAPFVWGFAGGGESVPPAFRGCLRPRDRIVEKVKETVVGLSRFDPFVRLTAARSRLILVNTPEVRTKLRRLTASPMEQVHAVAIDPEAVRMGRETASPRPRQPFVFATLARLLPWKGVHLGIEAFARLGRRDCEYWIFGEGPERARLEALAARLGVSDSVRFQGCPPRTECLQQLKRCHALIHSPLANTFNTVVLEAMVCGTPVIALKLGAAGELLDPASAYLVPCSSPAEAASGLAAAMAEVVDDPAEAALRGARGRDAALRHFTWTACIERLERWFEGVLAEEQRRTLRTPVAPLESSPMQQLLAMSPPVLD